jgi:predicted metal-dependent phosphoesterase TrpH
MSKHFAFTPRALARMVRMARSVGLDGVALTEHFHTAGYWDIHRHLADAFACRGGVFWADGVALIPGAEINIREGAHVVVLGDVAEIRRLDRAFPRLLSQGYEPRLREFLDVCDGFDLARIGAHMFRRTKELGGSDAHHWLQLGVRHTTMYIEEISTSSIIRTIREGLTGYGTSPYTPLRVKAAKSLKLIAKMLRKHYGNDGRPRRSQSLGVPASA